MLPRLLFFLAISHFLPSALAQAQGPDRLYLDIEIYRTRTDSLTASELIEPENQDLFSSPSLLSRSSAHDIYWIRITFSDIETYFNQYAEWAAYFGAVEKATLYYQQEGDLKKRDFGSLNEEPGARYDFHLVFNTAELIDGDYLLVKYQKLISTQYMGDYQVSVIPLDRLKSEQVSRDFRRLKNRTFTFIFTGIGGIVLLFAISAYVTQRRKEYLFYSFYLLFLLLYFGKQAFQVHGFKIGGSPLVDYIFHLEIQVLINLSYVLFARYFLNTAEVYPVLDRWIKGVALCLSIFIIADILFIQTGLFGIHYTAMNAQRYFMASFGVIGSIYLLVKRKSPLVYFIVAGSLSYTSGALGTLFLVDNDYMMAGSALEIFIFTLGLSYKSFALIRQNAQIEQAVLQLEMKALRAQMNPHFIFNSLGSIQHLVRKDRKKEALQYLSQFSRLLRQILESARQGTVTVEEEAELLEIYIKLEALRFERGFTHEVKIDPELDSHNLEIPILLVQPHVENAIIHGLLPKQGDAHLEVGFYNEPEFIRCEVVDNGVGRKASLQAAKDQRKTAHTSRGLSIVSGRLDQIRPDQAAHDLVQIIDIESDEGEALGTRVIISIPKEE